MLYENEMKLTPPQVHFLRSLMDGKREISEAEAQIRKEKLKLDAINFPLSVICISPFYGGVLFEKKDAIIEECSEYICRFLQKENYLYYCLTNSYDNYQILLPTDKNSLKAKDLDEVFIRLHQKISRHFNLSLFIGIGSIVSTYSGIAKSAAEAMEMLAYKYQYADRGVINIINTSRFKHYSVYGEDIMFTRVLGMFQDRNLGGMANRLDELIDSIRNRPGVSSTAIKRTIIELAVNILHIASNSDVDVDAITGDLDIYTWVLKQNHAEVLTEWLLNLSSELLDHMEKRKENDEKEIITQASDYIANHLSEPDLSLQSVSEAVRLSASYFSQLFKAETGIGVKNYIIDSRVSKAKLLLKETNLKSEDIALQTGFTSASYFGKAFKRSTGMTPNTYRKQQI